MFCRQSPRLDVRSSSQAQPHLCFPQPRQMPVTVPRRDPASTTPNDSARVVRWLVAFKRDSSSSAVNSDEKNAHANPLQEIHAHLRLGVCKVPFAHDDLAYSVAGNLTRGVAGPFTQALDPLPGRASMSLKTKVLPNTPNGVTVCQTALHPSNAVVVVATTSQHISRLRINTSGSTPPSRHHPGCPLGET